MADIRVQLYYRDMGVWRKDNIVTIPESEYNTMLRIPYTDAGH